MVRRDSQLVIEGFGGSANSYLVRVFHVLVDPGLRIAHHRHVPSQILQGLRWGIPCILVVRAPGDCAVSLLSRGFYPDAGLAMKHYIRFHRALLPVLDRVLVVPFERATGDVASVVGAVNLRYGTAFSTRLFDEEGFARVRQAFTRPADMQPLPTGERAEIKQSLQARIAALPDRLRSEADRVYRAVLAGAFTDSPSG